MVKTWTHTGSTVGFDRPNLLLTIHDKVTNKDVQLHWTSYHGDVPSLVPEPGDALTLVYKGTKANPVILLARPCHCYICTAKPVQHMVVCGDCGNKRCPHAAHHDNKCTNSNEPNQWSTTERSHAYAELLENALNIALLGEFEAAHQRAVGALEGSLSERLFRQALETCNLKDAMADDVVKRVKTNAGHLFIEDKDVGIRMLNNWHRNRYQT